MTHIRFSGNDSFEMQEVGIAHKLVTVTDNYTLKYADSGKTFCTATDAKVFTLPSLVAGIKYTFRNIGADGAVKLTISPAAADKIVGTIANSAADSVSGGVADKDIANTKATANKGDYITIEGGSDAWYIVGGVGIWASES